MDQKEARRIDCHNYGIDEQIKVLERATLRPLRAVALGKASEEDMAKLALIDSQVAGLRKQRLSHHG